ncbi:hypothetical protein DACRYDRAFT_25527 [Dacryopinax primogenitus]|uniref:Uncharacterized protein n=1 Tax=Dacryopinax primogenitus (strain DJM 731) TaxID=1858805 RepID=M5FN23_DACPD|nr:uncharacterized protein DACRYDRAFT_25527 [Dacryopinax primogenitus]EJT96695.1 hypothetical protein DACRYDRAFT_25527 [Dacryopinax primogenitus]
MAFVQQCFTQQFKLGQHSTPLMYCFFYSAHVHPDPSFCLPRGHLGQTIPAGRLSLSLCGN